MASQVSAVFHQWHAIFYQLMSVVEEIRADVRRYSRLSEHLREKTRTLLEATNGLGDQQIEETELMKIAVNALAAAEALRSILEDCSLPADEPLRHLYDEYSDSAEVIGVSADPEIVAAVKAKTNEPGIALGDFIKNL